MSQKGYYRLPEIFDNTIFFVCDEDIWSHNLEDDFTARRLTTSDGINTKPMLSPNGKTLAYISTRLGESNIYIMPSKGGVSQRITHFKFTSLYGWKDEKTIYVGSTHEHFTNREKLIYEVNIEDYTFKKIEMGPVSDITTSENGSIVIGRHTGDPARWKRYRGGTAGTLWVKENKKSKFKQILKSLPTNLANPRFIEERIYFISDHEGFGNIYSSNKRGTGIKRHTHHDEYYVRSFSYHSGKIVYSCGAELFLFDVENDSTIHIDVEVNSEFLQTKERFVDAEDYLQDFDMTRDAQELLINSRGKIFFMPPWSGGPIRIGDKDTRYKIPRIVWNDESEAVAAIKLDDENEESLVLFDLESLKEKLISKNLELGKTIESCPNPEEATLALTNNRNELILVNIDKAKSEIIDSSKTHQVSSLKWSPDGRFLTYRTEENEVENVLKIYDTKEKKVHRVINNVHIDYSPCFSSDSKTLFFLGNREFNPTSSDLLYQIGFPFLSKVYALPLTEQEMSPMKKFLNFEIDSDEDEDDQDEKSTNLKIDWDTLENRIEALPFGQGGFRDIFVHKDTIYIVKANVAPNDPNSTRWEDSKYNLLSYSFKEKKMKTLLKDIDPSSIKIKEKYLLVLVEGELRLISLENKPSEGDDYNKKDGWIDLSRIKIKHDPVSEWRQMYREAWVLQREHFWTPDMSKIDWVAIYKKYLPQLELVRTRSDFSDLIWEMQGELGTSHAYEFGGDYPNLGEPQPVGSLEARFEYHSRTKSFEIIEIFKGDSWLQGHDSPLTNAAVSLKIGDHIYAIDGESFNHANSLNMHLENKANMELSLLVKRKNKRTKELVSLVANSQSSNTLYRQWVNKNREYVKKKSNGKLGYVHIPDMSYKGFSEFWRAYSVEHQCQGLVIDVRYNGGGNVSQLLLKELQQKVLAFNQSRWFGDGHYPAHSVNGPLVCLTNQHAGSDGDIFSHCFKLLNLGKLIGKRTWGGVIGIWPRNFLNDFSLTSQPEFSFWFKDVGFDVENYGTEPDIEIDITPEDWQNRRDPQLEKGVEVVMKELKTRPPLKPNLSKRPNLKLPKLPKL